MPTGLGDEQLWLSATNDNTGTSTAFNDQSGEGNNGTATGALVVADTSEGGSYAFEFDGVDDYIQSSGPNDWTEQSVSFWMQTTGSADDFPRLVEKGLNSEWTVCFNTNIGGKKRISVQVGSGNSNAVSTTDMDDGAWHHVTAVIDAAYDVDLYVDGVLEDSGSGVSNSKTGDVFIGGTSFNGSIDFDGLIDDVRIYNRTLTQAEITHLASERGVEGPAPVGLGDEQLWLCPSINDSAADISGNGNNGTYQGGMGTVADTSNGGSLAYDFDGTGDHISVSGGVGTGTTDAFCLSFWWNWAGNGTDYVWDMDYTENNALSLLTKTSPSRLQAFARPDSDGSGNIYMGVSANTWTHIVYQRVAGSNQIKSYVNGVEFVVARTASDPITLGNDTTIGNSIAGTSLSAFEGMMDDIRWFNKSLTQPEITHLATSRGIEGSPSTPPSSVFFNPFQSKTFFPNYTRRIR